PDATVRDRIERMFVRALGRQPNDEERRRFAAAVGRFAELHGVPAGDVLRSPAVWRGGGHPEIKPEGGILEPVDAGAAPPRPVSFRPNAVAVFLRPNGAGVNSQRCQPLEPDPTNHQSPNGATVPKQEPAMPQSFACLYCHVIFSTKHRLPALTADLQLRLYE